MMSPHNTLGFRREIKRGNRASYFRTEELLCPCCGHLTRMEFDQDEGKGGSYPLTHCLNPNCEGYYMTRMVDAFFELYGKSNPLG